MWVQVGVVHLLIEILGTAVQYLKAVNLVNSRVKDTAAAAG
jgi:hypothetical protein